MLEEALPEVETSEEATSGEAVLEAAAPEEAAPKGMAEMAAPADSPKAAAGDKVLAEEASEPAVDPEAGAGRLWPRGRPWLRQSGEVRRARRWQRVTYGMPRGSTLKPRGRVQSH